MDLATMRFSVGCRQSIQQNNMYFFNSKHFLKACIRHYRYRFKLKKKQCLFRSGLLLHYSSSQKYNFPSEQFISRIKVNEIFFYRNERHAPRNFIKSRSLLYFGTYVTTQKNTESALKLKTKEKLHDYYLKGKIDIYVDFSPYVT